MHIMGNPGADALDQELVPLEEITDHVGNSYLDEDDDDDDDDDYDDYDDDDDDDDDLDDDDEDDDE